MAAVHPIVARPSRLALYLSVALAFGVLLALIVDAVSPNPGLRESLALAVPLALVYAFQCLTVWYPVRALSRDPARGGRLVVILTVASLLMAGVWTALGFAWARALESFGVPGGVERFLPAVPIVFAMGVFLFALAVLLHALFAAVERSQRAERRALELQVHAREAELKSLKAQLDPHFLFNSLNSVAALIGGDPPAARRMCFLMAGFFRKSLGLARRESIPLAEEIYLAETFLAIEEVRFGERLRSEFDVAEECLSLAVPPLVLQPLVENAVHHGVAHLVEGGVVRLAAKRREDDLELVVENPCDPDRPASRGTGTGLANVRARLETLFGHRARVEIAGGAESYRVSVRLPAEASAS